MLKEVLNCAGCKHEAFQLLHDFGMVPLAGYFPLPDSENQDNLVSMKLIQCKNCGLVQVNPIVEYRYLFSDYRYISIFSMKEHFADLATWVEQEKIPKDAQLLEIGSNDGTLLEELQNKGFRPVGVDPASNIVAYSKAKGHQVLEGHFSKEFVQERNLQGEFDFVISCNSFAHIENIRDIADAIYLCLKEEGKFLVEVQSWEELVRRKAFDFVYHEHKYYYDLNSISFLMSEAGFDMLKAEKIEIHGGSWRLLFGKRLGDKSPKEFPKSSISVQKVQEAISEFYSDLEEVEIRVREIVETGGKVIGFGASGRANMLLAYMNFGEDLTQVYDESPERVGRNMGFSKIKICALSNLHQDEYSHCLVLAWNFFDSISGKWIHEGKRLIRPLPKLEELET